MAEATTNTNTFSARGLVKIFLGFPVIAYVLAFMKDLLIAAIKTGPVPKHIAFIMDGNRRYAKNRSIKLRDGHSAGAETLINTIDLCYRLGIEHVTIYAFSIENFNRSQQEVDTLFELLKDKLKFLSEFDDSYANINKIKIRIIGNKSMIPEDLLTDLELIEKKTSAIETNRVLNVCFPYTSRDDITAAIAKVTELRMNNEIDEINVETIKNNMYLGPDCPDLDILVRTSGQYRLSDFMLWQANNNCTIKFTDKLWPDFGFIDLVLILLNWSFNKSIQSDNNAILGLKPNADNLIVVKSILNELPPPPPFHSTRDRN